MYILSRIFAITIAAATIAAIGSITVPSSGRIQTRIYSIMPPAPPIRSVGCAAAQPHDMVKVLINHCYGGFSFSDEFCAEFDKIYGAGAAPSFIANELYDPFLHDNQNFTNGKIASRYDPKIIELYERLGGSHACSGKFANLRAIEIPRALAPYITIREYDGAETLSIHITKMYRDLLDDIASRRYMRFCDTLAYEQIRGWEKYLNDRGDLEFY